MKLTRVRVKDFRSVENSGEFEIGDLTCLVGKNEAGKTAILNALYGLKPYGDFAFDKIRDYPRRHLSRFDERSRDGKSQVIKTWWKLEDEDAAFLESQFFEGILKSDTVTVETGFEYDGAIWNLEVDEKAAVDDLVARHRLSESEQEEISQLETTKALADFLQGVAEPSERQSALLSEIETFRKCRVVLAVIDALSKRLPKFFYTSHYERMSGELSMNKLAADKKSGSLEKGDEIFLDFLEYAGTSIEELQSASRFEELKAQCEGASNDITDEIFEFWSQNDALQVQIDLGEGRADDEPPYNEGTVAKIRIHNQNHRVSVPLSERSAGFVWFFSFLSQFKKLQAEAGNAIILLDEPGLTLHGKAQSDLLRYIEQRLLPNHQVIYTTHSPFMVPSDRLADVRVVEDLVEYGDRGKATVHGTKVSSDILSVDKDTLFPLQAHLGYEITQSLFIGKNTLLVEGPSDILYLQSLSKAVKDRGGSGLSSKWSICPTGGIDKILPFASLFSGNNLNIAVLCDFARGDKAKVQRLKESEILRSEGVFTYSDFTNKSEADVEDVFHPELFCTIVNSAYSLSGEDIITTDKISEVDLKTERVVKRVESLFNLMSKDIPEFDHFIPADHLLRTPNLLEGDSAEIKETIEVAEAIFTELEKLIS